MDTLTHYLQGLPHGSAKPAGENVWLVELTHTVEAMRLVEVENMMWLAREMPWWVHPQVGQRETQVSAEAVYLLWQRRDGHYGVIFPLANEGRRAFLAGGDHGLRVQLEGPGESEGLFLAVAVGPDPYALGNLAVTAASEALGTMRPREDKATPEWIDAFGWCTWDAFYSDVTADGVVEGLKTMHAAGVRPKLLILDDGWQHRKDQRLLAFHADPVKFPQGLKGLIDTAKRDFGVACFGVWHTLQGYWGGVEPESELGRAYRVIVSNRKLWRYTSPLPWVFNASQPTALVHPDDIAAFFDDWHKGLAAQGVDMIKVDNQASLMSFGSDGRGDVETMRAYQEALQRSAIRHFRGNLLHCMSHGNDIASFTRETNAWRNSDDFYPAVNPLQPSHLYRNAATAMWISAFAWPDWDMFQSTHPAAAFHAAGRAISGGPVYVSDKPGKHDAPLLKSLMTSDGRALRCATPAQITRDRFFIDCHAEPRLLKVFNRNGAAGVLGLFHCHWVGEKRINSLNHAGPITDTWRVTDVEGMHAPHYAAWNPIDRTLLRLHREQGVACTLAPTTAAIWHLCPIQHGLAMLGLIDKLNAAAAVEQVEQTPARLTATLRDGGTIGLYADRRPARVTLNGQPAVTHWDPRQRLLVIEAPEGEPVTVEVTLHATA